MSRGTLMPDTFGPPADWLHRHYGARPEDFEPTATPGYWQRREACGGRAGGCRNELHFTFFRCAGPVHHTVHYRDAGVDRATGRFASPYRTWREARRRFMGAVDA